MVKLQSTRLQLMCNKGYEKQRNNQHDNVYLRLMTNKHENMVFTWMALAFLAQLEVMGEQKP